MAREPGGDPHGVLGIPADLGAVGVFSLGMIRNPHLRPLLGARCLIFKPHRARGLDLVAGWGAKENTRTAQSFAARHGLPYVWLEDGFLRSVGLGGMSEPPLSIIADDRGMHYDATKPSRLEETLNHPGEVAEPRMLARASAAIRAIVENGLSKYNHTTAVAALPAPRGRYRILVVDQTAGDMSVKLGLADTERFAQMLSAARREHPDAEILVKTHPEVIAGRKKGHLDLRSCEAGVVLLSRDINPILLMREVEHVYAVTSQLGFEALLVGKPVTLFGVPFYAGWGLTDDRTEVPRRRVRRTLEELFAVAYIRYARYLDPDTGKLCELERVIEHLALQRRHFARNAGTMFCFDFGGVERRTLRRYLQAPGNQIHFVQHVRDLQHASLDERTPLVLREDERSFELLELAARKRAPIWRVGTGLVGTASIEELLAPTSLVLDRAGMYTDATRPSELESILESGRFGEEELARARRLRDSLLQIIDRRNARFRCACRVHADGRPVVLVAGQVQSDPCLRNGSVDVADDVALLEAVRQARPHAFLVYVPRSCHPGDVRAVGRSEPVARRLADKVLRNASLSACFERVDEVHTVSSLAAFEAVLRGIAVHTYGMPFFAGWGLTTDRHACPRRTRRLAIDELVAGTLLRYSSYVGLRTGRFTMPEVVLTEREPLLCRDHYQLLPSWAPRRINRRGRRDEPRS